MLTQGCRRPEPLSIHRPLIDDTSARSAVSYRDALCYPPIHPQPSTTDFHRSIHSLPNNRLRDSTYSGIESRRCSKSLRSCRFLGISTKFARIFRSRERDIIYVYMYIYIYIYPAPGACLNYKYAKAESRPPSFVNGSC